MFHFSQQSLDTLKGIHEDLVNVMMHAIQTSPVDFKIIQGLRTRDYQEALYAQGRADLSVVNLLRSQVGLPALTENQNANAVTWTQNSRHIGGLAIDFAAVVNGKLTWEISFYKDIALAILDAAKHLNVPIEWGGMWTKNKDYGHIELDSKVYPDVKS